MWLSMRVFIALCLVTLYCVEAQTELIFTPSNVQTRHVNVPQELIFVSSHNQPGTSKPENQGISQLLFTNSGQAKPYDESIFATATNFSPRQTHEDRPPVFASTPAQSLQRDLGVHLFASSAPGSSFSSSSYPTTTKAPYYDTTTYTPYFSNPTYPTYTTSAPSLGLGRSTIFSSSPSSPSSASFETNVKLPLGPPVFASNNVQSSSPSRTSTDFGTFAEGSLLNVSKGAEEFSLELLAKISNEHLSVPHRSYMVSPLSVWSLLVLLTEGAEGNTLTELLNTLRIQNDSPQSLRSAYRQINQRLNTVTNFVELAAYQAIYTDIYKPVQRDYEDIISREYRSVLTPVNFADVNTTFVKINDEIAKATRGLLRHSVLPQDLIDVQLLMISSLYFKGKWKFPFESYNTHWVPFHDEAGNVTGNVEMMMQTGSFNYAQIKAIDSHVLELPYGESNRMSMLVILPKKGTTLNYVMNSLRSMGISSMMQKLDEEERKTAEDGFPPDVEVYLPKFTTQSHFSIRYILENMGLIDVFQPSFANLTKISKDVFVSSIFQSTRIIVNEEGTEAAALSVAALINKASPVRFYFDRPFAYLIVEKTANLLLFAGEIKSHL